MTLSYSPAVLQQLGPLSSPSAILVGLLVLAAIVFVGRVVLAVAWRIVLVALAIAGTLWLLGSLGL